jgi:hypothetical protein
MVWRNSDTETETDMKMLKTMVLGQNHDMDNIKRLIFGQNTRYRHHGEAMILRQKTEARTMWRDSDTRTENKEWTILKDGDTRTQKTRQRQGYSDKNTHG